MTVKERKAQILIYHFILLVFFALSIILDMISVIFSDDLPIMLFFIIWAIVGVLITVVLQPLSFISLFPIKNATKSDYIKDVELAIVSSILTTIVTCVVKGIAFFRIGTFYGFAAPFGLLISIDHGVLPNEYLWGFRLAYELAVTLYAITTIVLTGSILAYYHPVNRSIIKDK